MPYLYECFTYATKISDFEVIKKVIINFYLVFFLNKILDFDLIIELELCYVCCSYKTQL